MLKTQLIFDQEHVAGHALTTVLHQLTCVVDALSCNAPQTLSSILLRRARPTSEANAIYGHLAIGPCATNVSKWGISEKSYQSVAQHC